MTLRVKITKPCRSARDNLALTTLETYDTADKSMVLAERTLQDVFNAVAEDPRAPLVKLAKRHDIPLEILEKGMSYMIAHMPRAYTKLMGPPATKHCFLIDENLPPNLSIRIWRAFGRAAHVNETSAQGLKDPELWNWATKKEFTAILTRDTATSDENEDLSMIALRHAHDYFQNEHRRGQPYTLKQAPVVIGFQAHSDKPVWGLMRRFQNQIHQELHQRKSPLLLVNGNGVHSAPTYRAIARNDWEAVKAMVQRPQ